MFSVSHGEEMISVASKKRKMICDETLNINDLPGGGRNMSFDNRNLQFSNKSGPVNITGRHFLTLNKGNCDSIFHTEEWLPSGSTLFAPLAEDIMVNTRNIEQFSSIHGQFFVADQSGQYSKTLTGQVLHLWRYCPEKRKLFISRSFLFQNYQDFIQVQQVLQHL